MKIVEATREGYERLTHYLVENQYDFETTYVPCWGWLFEIDD